MIFWPNTTISILTSTTEDAYGDAYDNASVAASGITASILEQPARLVSLHADDRRQVVRRYAGRISTKYDVALTDRIRDDRTGFIFVIDNISDSTHIHERRLEMRRVT